MLCASVHLSFIWLQFLLDIVLVYIRGDGYKADGKVLKRIHRLI